MSSEANGFKEEKIPAGYRLLIVGEKMRSNDLYWAHPGHWNEIGDDNYDVGYGWNESYRPVIRMVDPNAQADAEQSSPPLSYTTKPGRTEPCFVCVHFLAKDNEEGVPCSWCWKHNFSACGAVGRCGDFQSIRPSGEQKKTINMGRNVSVCERFQVTREKIFAAGQRAAKARSGEEKKNAVAMMDILQETLGEELRDRLESLAEKHELSQDVLDDLCRVADDF